MGTGRKRMGETSSLPTFLIPMNKDQLQLDGSVGADSTQRMPCHSLNPTPSSISGGAGTSCTLEPSSTALPPLESLGEFWLRQLESLPQGSPCSMALHPKWAATSICNVRAKACHILWLFPAEFLSPSGVCWALCLVHDLRSPPFRQECLVSPSLLRHTVPWTSLVREIFSSRSKDSSLP